MQKYLSQIQGSTDASMDVQVLPTVAIQVLPTVAVLAVGIDGESVGGVTKVRMFADEGMLRKNGFLFI